MREKETHLIQLDTRAHTLEAFDHQKIVLAVTHYFSEHYHEPITIPDLRRPLSLSLLQIETAFDIYKRKTASQALLEYRLNRLCDLICRDPRQEIGRQINLCGLNPESSTSLTSYARTNGQFIACFGIDLMEYHRQCFLPRAALLNQQTIWIQDDGEATALDVEQ